MENKYTGPERRRFLRLDYVTPLAYKICRQETISKLLKGYTVDISQAGVLCRIKEYVNKDDILWLSFDRATLSICAELDKRCFIYQNGIIGKVVRVEQRQDGDYNVGVQFITRVEENKTFIFPKIYFTKDSSSLNNESEEDLDENNGEI
jgi:c-di-GMP-binding flagellar brake protein YcgR